MEKTYVLKAGDISRDWYVVDAEGQTLGRLSTRIATVLRGKHKATFSPHLDNGDHVIVINAAKIVATGNKMDAKKYYRHSGYPGGLTTTSLREMLEKHPERAIQYAVKGMLPKNRLGRQMIKKLKVYSGSDHPHEAQQPEVIEMNRLGFNGIKTVEVPTVSVSASAAAPKAAVAKPEVAAVAPAAAPVAEDVVEAAAPAPKAPAKKKKAAKADGADDLTKIEGIGPKIAELMRMAGITTFAEMAATDADKLQDVLREAGSRYNRHDATTWPKQAGLAASGDWDALKALQDELDGGRE